ncbi:MAG: hypothetical protein ACMG57_00200 [Candidatus Dojkabacteria bacterium]
MDRKGLSNNLKLEEIEMIIIPNQPKVPPKVLIPLILVSFIIAFQIIGRPTENVVAITPTPFLMDLSHMEMKGYNVDITITDSDKNVKSLKGKFNYALLTSKGDWKEIDIQAGKSNVMICWTEALNTGIQYTSKACGYDPNSIVKKTTVLETPGFYFSRNSSSCSNGDGNKFEIDWLSQTTIQLTFETSCSQKETWIITFQPHDLYPNGAGK